MYKSFKERLCSTYKLSKPTYAQHYSKLKITLSKPIFYNPNHYILIKG
ncbi:hypothetical protein T190611E02C_60128 [Tenacibaculum sp. 190524A05c]